MFVLITVKAVNQFGCHAWAYLFGSIHTKICIYLIVCIQVVHNSGSQLLFNHSDYFSAQTNYFSANIKKKTISKHISYDFKHICYTASVIFIPIRYFLFKQTLHVCFQCRVK